MADDPIMRCDGCGKTFRLSEAYSRPWCPCCEKCTKWEPDHPLPSGAARIGSHRPLPC